MDNISQENVFDYYETNSRTKVFRTPVSLLFEICVKSCCVPPIYKLVKETCNQSKYLFVYNCYLNENLQANGESYSKQKAKHVAALNVLKKLKQINVGVNDDLASKLENMINCLSDLDLNEDLSSVLRHKSSSSSSSSMFEDNGLTLTNIQYDCKDVKIVEAIQNEVINCENPFAELIDIAFKHSIRQPEYIIENEAGPSHNKQFLCVAKLGDLKESGSGRTKKLAKRYAAFRLLFKVKLSHRFNDQQKKKPKAHFEKIEDSSGNFFSQLKSSKNTAMNLLITRDLNKISNRIFLDQLSREENFKYDVYKVPTNRMDSQAYVVQLNTTPQLLYGGYGNNQEEAINNAIYFTLNNIKDVCVGRNF